MLGHRLHLDGVAQIGLVGAVFADRLVIGNARPLLGHRLALGELLEHRSHHRLAGLPHVFLRDEAHFEIELVELARQAVGPRVLVAETGRDLEIPVEPGNHQQLLVLLRRLRQREELARMQAARHQEVARPFWRRSRQDRGRIFREPGIGHLVAHRRDDLGALDDIGVQRFAPQIEEAVSQPHVLGIVRLAEHGQRQFPGLAQDLDLADEHLDLAGRQVGIDRLWRAGLHLAIDAEHPFGAHLLGLGESGRIGIDHGLGNAVVVAQIDEQQPAMVTDAVDPAAQAHTLADI